MLSFDFPKDTLAIQKMFKSKHHGVITWKNLPLFGFNKVTFIRGSIENH